MSSSFYELFYVLYASYSYIQGKPDYQKILTSWKKWFLLHHNDVIMSAMVSQISGVSIVLLNGLFRRRSKIISKLHVTGLCEGNPPVTGAFASQRASNAENISIWWYHHINISGGFHPKLVTPPYHGFLNVNTPPNNQNSKRHISATQYVSPCWEA